MKVFKFGGASVKNYNGVINVSNILLNYKDEKLLIVISAMGKTTNALEKVVGAYFNGDTTTALQLFEQVKQQHLTTAKYLLVANYLACEAQLKDFFTEVEWLLHDKPVREYDYYYDQIVCIGELLSTAIVHHYLKEKEINNVWMDVRDIIRTDNNFRDANVDWNFTKQKVEEIIAPAINKQTIVITQGFIGATDENESTTLGREGSDYTAALFANMLNAESLTIWKDVENVMNADPRHVPNAVPLPQLSYSEVIEMAYYGAQVIHPKTIKPLQNKSIPLYVKCFLDAALPGTVVYNKPVKDLPPIIVLKENQVMVEFKSKDFSFVGESHTGKLYHLFEVLSIRPNLTQNQAISLTCVFDDREDKINELAIAAADFLDVSVMKGLSLLTIRHYNEESITKFAANKKILIEQKTPQNISMLLTSEI